MAWLVFVNKLLPLGDARLRKLLGLDPFFLPPYAERENQHCTLLLLMAGIKHGLPAYPLDLVFHVK